MFNSVNLSGRLTRDPELKQTPSGVSVVSFAVANNRHTANGDETHFFDCVAWRKTAEFVAKNLHKGRMVEITGRLQTRSYTDKNGQNRKFVEILAEDVRFGDYKGGNSEQPTAQAQQPQPFASAPDWTNAPVEESEDLPF